MTQVEDAHIVALIVDEKNVFGGWHPAVRQADAKRLITQPSHICGEPFTIHAGRWVLEMGHDDMDGAAARSIRIARIGQ